MVQQKYIDQCLGRMIQRINALLALAAGAGCAPIHRGDGKTAAGGHDEGRGGLRFSGTRSVTVEVTPRPLAGQLELAVSVAADGVPVADLKKLYDLGESARLVHGTLRAADAGRRAPPMD